MLHRWRLRRPALVAITLLTLLATSSCSSNAKRQVEGLTFAGCGALVDLTSEPSKPRLDMLQFSCGKLRVPLDYSHADGEQITLQVVRVHHKKQVARIGSLLMHPGGPGQSGLGSIAHWAQQLSEDVLKKFDLVTLDPRGTGASAPVINCGGVPEDHQVNRDPDLRTASGFARAVAAAKHLTDACVAALGARTPHFTTEAAARDLDVLRVQLGEKQLNYLGFSYGAKLGGEYARQFPSKIRAMVLDAPSDPRDDPLAVTERQVAGFEHAFGEYARACATRPTCTRIGNPKAFITRLAKAADANPIPSGRPQDSRPATGSQVLGGTLALLYDDATWPALDDALLEADGGDSGGLFEAKAHVIGYDGDPGPNVARPDHATYVINCNDTSSDPTQTQVMAAAVRLVSNNPIFGVFGSSFLLGCSYWQPQRHALALPAAPSAPPIVVIGTVNDPVTPYPGAVGFAQTIGPATLLTWEGQGHTAYLQSPCINLQVDRYLIDLTVPAKGTRCPG